MKFDDERQLRGKDQTSAAPANDKSKLTLAPHGRVMSACGPRRAFTYA
jgi:hypothetical protein